MIEKSDVLEMLARKITAARSHEAEVKLREIMHDVYEIPEIKAVPVKATLGDAVYDVRLTGQSVGQIVERVVRGFQMTKTGEIVYCLENPDNPDDKSYVYGDEFWTDRESARPTALKVQAEKQKLRRRLEETRGG